MLKNLNARLSVMNDEKRRYKIPKVKPGKVYPSQLWGENEEPPSHDVMKRLEQELGSFASMEAIANPSLNDKMLLSSDSVNMALRELNHIEQEDLMDPSDFVQVEQKE